MSPALNVAVDKENVTVHSAAVYQAHVLREVG